MVNLTVLYEKHSILLFYCIITPCTTESNKMHILIIKLDDLHYPHHRAQGIYLIYIYVEHFVFEILCKITKLLVNIL
jgi:hypothetical protein